MRNDALDQFACYLAAREEAWRKLRLRAYAVMAGLVALVLMFGAICFYLGRISVEASSVRPLTIQSRIG